MIRFSMLLVLLLGFEVHAQQRDTSSGSYYLRGCKLAVSGSLSNNDVAAAQREGQCIGVIQALLYVGPELSGLKFCPPPHATFGQALTAVVRFMERNPQQMHLEFIGLVQVALHETWPCT